MCLGEEEEAIGRVLVLGGLHWLSFWDGLLVGERKGIGEGPAHGLLKFSLVRLWCPFLLIPGSRLTDGARFNGYKPGFRLRLCPRVSISRHARPIVPVTLKSF